MDIEQLKHFVVVAGTGSILSASERMYISRSALSKSISRLENELGASLFVRRTNGVSLTEEGKKFLPAAENAVKAFIEAERVLLKPGSRPSLVKIGFTYGTYSFFADRIAGFCKEFPNIIIENVNIDPRDVPPALLAGDIDLCCGDCLRNESNIVHQLILRDKILYGVRSDSEEARNGMISFANGLNYKLLGPNSGKQAAITREDADGNMTPVELSENYLPCDDMTYLFNCVKKGIGVLSMPETLSKFYDPKGITFVPSEPIKYWEIQIHYLKNNLNSLPKMLIDQVFVRMFL